MNLSFLREREGQKYLILIFFLLLSLIIFILGREFFLKKSPPPINQPLLEIPREIKIDFQIFNNPIFQNLKDLPPLPSFQEGPGKKNPFLPG